MAFDWNKYVVLSDELRMPSGSAGMEARLRSGISRGYYGVFHVARLWLEREGAKFNAGVDIHQLIVQNLVTSGHVERERLGRDLGRLRRMRNQADYAEEIQNLPHVEATSHSLRESIQRQLKSLMNAN